jgi:hypothetical protein
VSWHSFNVPGKRVAPEFMLFALTFEKTAMASEVTEKFSLLHSLHDNRFANSVGWDPA